jgi:hypothetical protein
VARENGQIGAGRLMDRRLLEGIGVLAVVGGVAFFLDAIPAIGVYLVAAGLIFLGFSQSMKRRYGTVLTAPPDGYRFTGERLPNPPDGGYVEVWHRGIARVYVQAQSDSE